VEGSPSVGMKGDDRNPKSMGPAVELGGGRTS
jgi:hypothetical protein